MIIAIWIIAVCEVIRAVQNMMQIAMYKHDAGNRDISVLTENEKVNMMIGQAFPSAVNCPCLICAGSGKG